MWYIVGLGNPGKEYEVSRHNAGWLVLDVLQHRLDLSPFSFQKKTASEISRSNRATLIKPQTYMNDSGRAVRAVLEYYENPTHLSTLVEKNLIVIHDDLDLELGTYKLVHGTGPKVHNGLLSLYAHLKTEQFWHLRMGVDSRDGDRSMPGSAYVLQSLRGAEKDIFMTTAESAVAELVELLDEE